MNEEHNPQSQPEDANSQPEAPTSAEPNQAPASSPTETTPVPVSDFIAPSQASSPTSATPSESTDSQPVMNPSPTMPPALPEGKRSPLKSKKVWLLLILLVILIIVIVLALSSSKKATQASLTVKSPVKTTPTLATATTAPIKPLPAGTDNSSLSSDLNNINSSMNQESSDQSAANGALNDSSQQITIPTN